MPARTGKPTVDTEPLKGVIAGCGVLNDMIAIESPEHWGREAPCMMSNMYPASSVGALADHSGTPCRPTRAGTRRSRGVQVRREDYPPGRGRVRETTRHRGIPPSSTGITGLAW